MTALKSLFWPSEAQTDYQKIVIMTVLMTCGMLLIILLLNYGTLAKLILAKLASKNRMPGFMRPDLVQ
jgi:predicted signal transduction protein with EAL and GGDEF domain